MISDNYLANQTVESLLTPQQFTDPLGLPMVSESNLISPRTIAFVDPNIAEASTVMANLRSDIKIFLDPTRDGINQITEALKNYQGLSGIEIISHGNVAALQLGNSYLSANSLPQYANDLQQWRSAMAPAADILFYGCNVADGESGRAFINEIGNLTGADVAASTNTTGSSAKGGDWTLEYATGSIETATPVTDALIDSYQGILPSLFTTQTPAQTNLTDGAGSAGDYELGMEFVSAKAGQINAIRYYKATSETGPHVGRIWSLSTGQELANVTFTNETSSGWQEQTLATPLNIAANTTYVVSVNTNQYYVATENALATTITNGDISAVADGSNGVYNATPSALPTRSYRNSNYFRDIVFTPTPPVNNTPGNIALTGTPTQNQTLSAAVSDPNGLTGVTINYQWQQSSDGTTWTNINGATNSTFTLAQAQVGNRVRVGATYTDVLGSSENILSNPTPTNVANVNDPGGVTLAGTAASGQTLSANVTDLDGLTGVTPTYQWQQSTNGTTWTPISGATSSTLTLDSSYVGTQVRVNASYTDALGGTENILSNPSSAITAVATTTQSLFAANATPQILNATDGVGSAGDYELGMEFQTAKTGQINAIRYYKAASETGTHVGRIWSSTGTLLASVTFTNETGSGWQEQTLATPLNIAANTTYVVSVNINQYYVATENALATTITNGDISAVADGSNGVYNATPSALPTRSYRNSNYFRDIVFTPTPPVNNTPGNITLTGTPTQNQTLSAAVTDVNGLNGATINYQWQQSSDGTTWTNINGAMSQTFTLSQVQVNQQVRATATYTDAMGSNETPISTPTSAVVNVNDVGTVILKGSATVGHDLDDTVVDADGLSGSPINYQWQQFVNNTWSNIAGATSKSFALTSALLGQQVRVLASYIDAIGTNENVASTGVTVAAQNAIVLENQQAGTTAWQLTNVANNKEIEGFGDATSINKGQTLNLKVSMAQAGQYNLDVYRLGYYGGAGGRLISSVTGLNGVTQAGATFNPTTRLVEYPWNTSYALQTGTDWTSGLYVAKLTDSLTGKQNYIQFVVRDDNRPADIGFQDAINTAAAYNNYGGYSTYNSNSAGVQRAYQVSFDRPFQYTSPVLTTSQSGAQYNNTFTWEYSMTRWLESQGYDVSYYTNLDVSTNPLQLYSQKTFLSVGHDEYWTMEQRNNVEQARDNGINLAFFSANTAYWQARYEPSSSGQANRTLTVYKDTTGKGLGTSIDPITLTNPAASTTLFRSPEVNRPENALLGVGYVGDGNNVYGGYDFMVTNAADPYYAHTGLQNGDVLPDLVGYEWDGLLNNGLTPPGLVVLSASPVPPDEGTPVPPGTNTAVSNAVRYTAASGAKVFATGSIQWVWGLNSDLVPNHTADPRAQQIAVNVFADMGAQPQTPSAGIVVT